MIFHYDIKIEGKVQNVGFRFYAQKKAHELEITGYVKNMKDGSVFIEAEGEEINLNQYVNWCHKGPPWATVTDVKVNQSPVMKYRGFLIK